MHIISYSLCANCRLTAYYGYCESLPQDVGQCDILNDRAKELWNDFLYWLDLYAKKMHELTGTNETALCPLDNLLLKMFK